MAIYEALGGEEWTYWRHGWRSEVRKEVSAWPQGPGITFNEQGRVVKLELTTNGSNWKVFGLNGELPPQLGNLTELQVLDLNGNGLSGELPAQLGNLTNLQMLDLSGNGLSGELPPQLGNLANLQVLDLRNSGLTGELPPELGNLDSLHILDLSGNAGLTGPVPAEIGRLANLGDLKLDHTGLSGPLPPEMQDLVSLAPYVVPEWGGYYGTGTGPNFSYSGLCVPPPLEEFLVPKLRYQRPHGQRQYENDPNILAVLCEEREALVAIHEALGGDEWTYRKEFRRGRSSEWREVKPENWLSDAPLNTWTGVTTNDQGQVVGLNLPSFGLEGALPPELGDLVNLVALDLSNNFGLTGELPPELGNLTNLQVLDLSNSGLTRELPPQLGNLTSLVDLDLSRNPGLTGPVPAEIGRLVNLGDLKLDHTGLSGPLPPEMLDLVSLAPYVVPEWGGYYSTGTGPNFSYSGLCVPLPLEEFLVPKLRYSRPHGQRQRENDPNILGVLCEERKTLAAMYKPLKGSGPDLQGWLSEAPLNEWEGVRTNDRGQVVELNLAGKGLTGEVPEDWAIRVRESLRVLDLSGNGLTGEIPWELAILDELQVLDLSGNKLEGNVPRDLKDLFDTLSVMDLSGNQLQGGIKALMEAEPEGNYNREETIHVDVRNNPWDLELSGERNYWIAFEGEVTRGFSDLAWLIVNKKYPITGVTDVDSAKKYLRSKGIAFYAGRSITHSARSGKWARVATLVAKGAAKGFVGASNPVGWISFGVDAVFIAFDLLLATDRLLDGLGHIVQRASNKYLGVSELCLWENGYYLTSADSVQKQLVEQRCEFEAKQLDPQTDQ